MRLAIEEKRLTDDRLQAVDAEWLGYEKGGLRRRSGQETLWIGGNENHRHGESFEDLIDRFETRASVGQLNVREDEAWPFAPNGRDRLAMGARDIDDTVPLLLDEGLKVERNEWLVLDDQDVGANLAGDLLAGGVDERSSVVNRAIERARDFGGIEAFERTEKEREIELQTPAHAQQSLSAVVSQSDASDRPGDTPTIWRIYWPRRRPTRLDSNYFLFEKTLHGELQQLFC